GSRTRLDRFRPGRIRAPGPASTHLAVTGARSRCRLPVPTPPHGTAAGMRTMRTRYGFATAPPARHQEGGLRAPGRPGAGRLHRPGSVLRDDAHPAPRVGPGDGGLAGGRGQPLV